MNKTSGSSGSIVLSMHVVKEVPGLTCVFCQIVLTDSQFCSLVNQWKKEQSQSSGTNGSGTWKERPCSNCFTLFFLYIPVYETHTQKKKNSKRHLKTIRHLLIMNKKLYILASLSISLLLDITRGCTVLQITDFQNSVSQFLCHWFDASCLRSIDTNNMSIGWTNILSIFPSSVSITWTCFLGINHT